MSALFSKLQFSKFRPINIIAGMTAIILSLYLLVWFSSPWVFRYVIQDTLRPFNLNLSEESYIRYNPFTTSLYVENLGLSNDGGRVFYLENSALDIDLTSLVNMEVEVESFHIQDLELVVDLSADDTVISGFLLPEAQSSADVEPVLKEVERSFVKDLILLAQELTVTQSRIIIKKNDLHRIIEINDLKVSNASLAERHQVFDLSLNLGVEKSVFVLDLKLRSNEGAANVEFSTSLDQFMLGVIAPEIKDIPFEFAGNVSFDISGSAEFQSSLKNLLIDSASISVADLSVSNDAILFSQEKLGLEINSMRYKNNEDQGELANFGVNVSMSKTSLNDKVSNDVLVSFEKFSASPINIEIQPDSMAESVIVNAGELAMDNIVLSNVDAEKTPALVKLGSLRVSDIGYTHNQLKAGAIILADLNSQILIDNEKNITTLVKIPITDEPKQQAAAASKPTAIAGAQEDDEGNASADFKMKLDRIELAGENIVSFRDASVEPAHVRTVVIETAFIENINNNDNTPSPFKFAANTNKYTTVNLEGEVSPFTETTNLTLKGAAREFSLPTISSYIKEPLGFEINSGQLDADFDVTVVESVIEGGLQLLMRGADMTSSDNGQANSTKDKAMIPLNVALGMLQDGDGNIVLDIPLDGRVDSPEFGVHGLILLVAKKAALSQAKTYLINSITPYASVITIAMAAGDFALKLRFEDLPYAPANVDIGEQQQEYLNQFVALLKDKPTHQIKVCGIATSADINQPAEALLSDPDLIKHAKDISSRRAKAFKHYVIETGEISSGRLLICAPQVDFSEGALPRIELSL